MFRLGATVARVDGSGAAGGVNVPFAGIAPTVGLYAVSDRGRGSCSHLRWAAGSVLWLRRIISTIFKLIAANRHS